MSSFPSLLVRVVKTTSEASEQKCLKLLYLRIEGGCMKDILIMIENIRRVKESARRAAQWTSVLSVIAPDFPDVCVYRPSSNGLDVKAKAPVLKFL